MLLLSVPASALLRPSNSRVFRAGLLGGRRRLECAAFGDFQKLFSSAALVEYDEDEYWEPKPVIPHPSTVQDEKNRLVTIRFYRMLLRQCQNLVDPNKADTEHIMLQPMVQHSLSQSVYVKTGPPVVTRPLDIYKLFHALLEYENTPKPDITSQIDQLQYQSSSFSRASKPSVKNADLSIDDWFYEVTGGVIPVFPNDDDEDELRTLLTKTCWTSKSQLKYVLKKAFTANYQRVSPSSLTKLAFQATQLLRKQRELWKRSSVATTDRIRVIATSRHIGEQMVRTAEKKIQTVHRFSYRIRIENLSPHHVQLLGRFSEIQELEDNETWEKDKNIRFQRKPLVERIGVVKSGQANVLRPGQCFEFMSATDLATPKGSLQGKFYMRRVLPVSAMVSDSSMDNLPMEDGIEVVVAPLALQADSRGED